MSSSDRSQGISPRTLSLRLRALEEHGIVERRTYPEVPPRVEYALTEKGRALVPLIEDMRAYGRRWLLEERPPRVRRRRLHAPVQVCNPGCSAGGAGARAKRAAMRDLVAREALKAMARDAASASVSWWRRASEIPYDVREAGRRSRLCRSTCR